MLVKVTTISDKPALVNTQYVSQVTEQEDEEVGTCIKIYNADGTFLVAKGTRDDFAEIIYPLEKGKACPELKYVETVEIKDPEETKKEDTDEARIDRDS